MNCPTPSDVPLDDMCVALQPVLNLRTGRVRGFEALLRGRGGTCVPTLQLYRRARREGWLDALEQRARSLAFASARRHLTGDELLFLNCDVRIPLSEEHYRRLVVEISEPGDIDAGDLDRLRLQGVQVFLDDYGVANGTLGRMLDVQPGGLKLDRSIVRGISRDPRRFCILQAITALSRDLGIDVVAEGIETSEDLVAVRSAGFEYGQGYYLGRPVLAPDRRRLAETAQLLHDTVLDVVTYTRQRKALSAS